jgi:hypothetical protein
VLVLAVGLEGHEASDGGTVADDDLVGVRGLETGIDELSGRRGQRSVGDESPVFALNTASALKIRFEPASDEISDRGVVVAVVCVDLSPLRKSPL